MVFLQICLISHQIFPTGEKVIRTGSDAKKINKKTTQTDSNPRIELDITLQKRITKLN